MLLIIHCSIKSKHNLSLYFYVMSFITLKYLLIFWIIFCRKNLPDFSTSKEKNDLGYVTIDLQSGILSLIFKIFNTVLSTV